MKSHLRTLMVLAIALNGCNSLNFEIADVPTGDVKHERKSYFLWGLAPTRLVDVSEHCPRGAKAVKEETNFGDGFLTLITLGIYSPRSSTYICQ